MILLDKRKDGKFMDIIILGLLMIQNSTIYEIRKAIETNFTNISSSSTGSIHSAINKLQGKNFILVNEFVENSVNKKVYEITVAGKEYFYENITKPMLYKDKNMELGKFIFMGFVPKEKRSGLIEAYISELKKELDALLIISSGTQPRYAFDENYIEYLKSKGMSKDITNETFMDIALFQYATLDLAIAKIEFEIKWFENFKQKLLCKEDIKC